MQWFSRSLNRKFLIGTAAGLLTISVVFMLLFLGMYRAQLERERSEASSQVNSLLQASLENAMLKRDLDGLRGIVNRLGNQEGIQGVMIINPKDEVRFSSHPEMLGRHYQRDLDPACISCHVKGAEATEYTHFTVDDRGREVLRSVNPVHNKLPCTECHGPIEKNPINGVLFVDYDAAAIRQNAQTTTLMLMGAGATVVLVTLLGGWWFMQNIVLKPVRQLHDTSQAL
ncbi:MAG: histidine kinase, partial [Gammaproteobacteria bacterium]|nr:histidine kinase [Gammaproteobacteria bacterium]